jgi:hypothetical protein
MFDYYEVLAERMLTPSTDSVSGATQNENRVNRHSLP